VIWLTIADLQHEINASEKGMRGLGKLLPNPAVIGSLLNRDIGVARDDEM
jgi:hypothetical protein